jgi:hypothetical protein
MKLAKKDMTQTLAEAGQQLLQELKRRSTMTKDALEAMLAFERALLACGYSIEKSKEI